MWERDLSRRAFVKAGVASGALTVAGGPRRPGPGAVVLGKTNLSEWANIRALHSTSGWSGRGGQFRNPYVLDRSPSGSSSGSGAATAALTATSGATILRSVVR